LTQRSLIEGGVPPEAGGWCCTLIEAPTTPSASQPPLLEKEGKKL
jgi:hypothetical protein